MYDIFSMVDKVGIVSILRLHFLSLLFLMQVGVRQAWNGVCLCLWLNLLKYETFRYFCVFPKNTNTNAETFIACKWSWCKQDTVTRSIHYLYI